VSLTIKSIHTSGSGRIFTILIVFIALITGCEGRGPRYWKDKVTKSKLQPAIYDGAIRYNFGAEQFEIYTSQPIANYRHCFGPEWQCADQLLREKLGIYSIKKRIGCVEKDGHKWRYSKRESSKHLYDTEWTYKFQCERCDVGILKYKHELSCQQRKALESLGIIRE